MDSRPISSSVLGIYHLKLSRQCLDYLEPKVNVVVFVGHTETFFLQTGVVTHDPISAFDQDTYLDAKIVFSLSGGDSQLLLKFIIPLSVVQLKRKSVRVWLIRSQV